MKKLFTLLILIGGFVCTANATVLHIGLEVNYTGNVYVHYFGGTTNSGAWESAPAATLDGNLYGRRWYHIDIGDNTNAIVKLTDSPWNDRGSEVTEISGDNCYIYLSSEDTNKWIDGMKVWNTGKLVSKGWQTMKFSNDLDDKWDDAANECTKVDDNTFTYTLTKSQIASKSSIYFRFKLANGVFFVGSDYWSDHFFRIGAPSDNTSISIDQPTSNISHTTDKEYNWVVTVPTAYTYDKLVFTIKDLSSGTTFENSSTWQVRVDAYLPSITTNGYGYCTYVNPVPLTISSATAYYATDRNNGSARAHAITNPPANTPMLIKGEPNTFYSFKVAATGEDDPSGNVFMAGPVASLESTSGGKYNYILNGETFKAANKQSVASGKAYLQLSAAASARPLVFSDNDDTGISVVTTSDDKANTTYNLSGQRVANPSKGLYIVNGRKVIIK